jgi:hypothetical protein
MLKKTLAVATIVLLAGAFTGCYHEIDRGMFPAEQGAEEITPPPPPPPCEGDDCEETPQSKLFFKSIKVTNSDAKENENENKGKIYTKEIFFEFKENTLKFVNVSYSEKYSHPALSLLHRIIQQEFEYDENGKVSKITNRRGTSTDDMQLTGGRKPTYDEKNRLSSFLSLDFAINAQVRDFALWELEYSIVATQSLSINKNFAFEDKPVTEWEKLPNLKGKERKVSIEYNNAGLPVKILDNYDQNKDSTIRYVYNEFGIDHMSEGAHEFQVFREDGLITHATYQFYTPDKEPRLKCHIIKVDTRDDRNAITKETINSVDGQCAFWEQNQAITLLRTLEYTYQDIPLESIKPPAFLIANLPGTTLALMDDPAGLFGYYNYYHDDLLARNFPPEKFLNP